MGIVITVFVTFLNRYQQRRESYVLGANIIYPSGEVLGLSTSEESITIDFSNQIAVGSPLVFGGAHTPKLEHPMAWDQISSVGVTSVRSDFFLDRFIPNNITLFDYKSNRNNVQDPSNWNQAEIEIVRNRYKQAKNRGMSTIGIASYAVKWLTYNNSNYGVPIDWEVYEDLVRKSYTLFRDDLDYLEIWNEADYEFFLDVKNSGMTREEAYYQITKHAIKAIRDVDNHMNDGKRIRIGVGAISQPTKTSVMNKVLSDSQLLNEISFVSYHNYEHVAEPSNFSVKQLLKEKNLEEMPIFLTEWSHTPTIKKQDEYVLDTIAIPYAGYKFMNYLNMGLAGANYFSMQPIQPDSKRGDEGFLGFYKFKVQNTELLPIAKTWQLMSNTLSLGKGPSQIFQSKAANGSAATACKNNKGEYCLVFSNDLKSSKTYNVTLYNLPINNKALLTAYVAASDQNGDKKLGSLVVQNRGTGVTFKILTPPESVVGVIITPSNLIDSIFTP